MEAVQNIQSITQALQKAKENYNSKCVEQERLKKEGATQREIEKVTLVESYFRPKNLTDCFGGWDLNVRLTFCVVILHCFFIFLVFITESSRIIDASFV